MRILLVDDEAAIQRAVGPLLRARGYEVEIASTGSEALQLFEQRSPDLLVLDLGLPDIEGTEVCRRLRAKSQVPIIVLSARSAEAGCPILSSCRNGWQRSPRRDRGSLSPGWSACSSC